MALFCPWCLCKDHPQPVLSPMICAYILDRRTTPTDPNVDKHNVLEPHYEYRCERCGMSEIHHQRIGSK